MLQPSIPFATAESLVTALPDGAGLLAVDVAHQRIHLLPGGGNWPVSTGRAGLGNRVNSGCTPLGWHRIKARFGDGADTGQAFKGRVAVPEVPRDAILARILWLEGLETGLNRPRAERYLYVHGTNEIAELGTPASAGCIRMAPADIVEVFARAATRDLYCWVGRILAS